MHPFPMFHEDKQALRVFCSGRKQSACDQEQSSLALHIEQLHYSTDEADPMPSSKSLRAFAQRSRAEPLQVLLDGDLVRSSSMRGSKINIPSGKITLTLEAMSSRLQLRLSSKHGRCLDTDCEVLEVQVTMNELASFGAPLYTSLWLGFMPSDQDLRLENYLASAREANIPKVKLTIFDQTLLGSLPPTLSYSTPRQQVRRGPVSEAVNEFSCFGRTPRTNRSSESDLSIPQCLEGLMKCVDESNATIGVLLSACDELRNQQRGQELVMREKNDEIARLREQLIQMNSAREKEDEIATLREQLKQARDVCILISESKVSRDAERDNIASGLKVGTPPTAEPLQCDDADYSAVCIQDPQEELVEVAQARNVCTLISDSKIARDAAREDTASGLQVGTPPTAETLQCDDAECSAVCIQYPQVEPVEVARSPTPQSIAVRSCTPSPCGSPAAARQFVRLPTFGMKVCPVQAPPTAVVKTAPSQEHSPVHSANSIQSNDVVVTSNSSAVVPATTSKPPSPSAALLMTVVPPRCASSPRLPSHVQTKAPTFVSPLYVSSPRQDSRTQNVAVTSSPRHQTCLAPQCTLSVHGGNMPRVPPLLTPSPRQTTVCQTGLATPEAQPLAEPIAGMATVSSAITSPIQLTRQETEASWPSIPNLFYTTKAVKQED